MFGFNISVSNNTDAGTVFVNWTHGNQTGNESLFPWEGHWLGGMFIEDNIGDLAYTIYINDTYGNYNISPRQFVRIIDVYDPNYIGDFSSDTGAMGDTFEFNISAGVNIDIDDVFVNWVHGGRSGNLSLTGTNGYWIGSIILDNIISDLTYTVHIIDPPPDLNATTYLLDKEKGADPMVIDRGFDRLFGISSVSDLDQSIDDIGNQMNFGIPGLLTMMFITAIIASFTSAFAFSSIIIKRRLREFAVLQTIGASRWQVYKIAIGENALLMFISVVLGMAVGLCLSYQMNGFFEIMGELLSRGSLTRVVFIPWAILVVIGVAIFLGMLLAVAVSAISAARQDLAVSTRVI